MAANQAPNEPAAATGTPWWAWPLGIGIVLWAAGSNTWEQPVTLILVAAVIFGGLQLIK